MILNQVNEWDRRARRGWQANNLLTATVNTVLQQTQQMSHVTKNYTKTTITTTITPHPPPKQRTGEGEVCWILFSKHYEESPAGTVIILQFKVTQIKYDHIHTPATVQTNNHQSKHDK